jgi:O-antigen/teichoic acid export membrane protein
LLSAQSALNVLCEIDHEGGESVKVTARARAMKLARHPAAKAAGVSFLLRALTLGSRLLLSLLMARLLLPAEMGLYGLVSAALAFALLAVGLEFYTHTMREMVTLGPAERVRILANQAALFCCSFAVTAVIALGASAFGLLPIAITVWVLVLVALEELSLDGARTLIVSSRQAQAYMVLFLRGGLWVYVVGAVMLVYPETRSIYTVLIGWAAGGAIGTAYALFCLRTLPWRALAGFRPDWTWIQTGLRTVQPFIATAIGTLALTYVDRFVIESFMGRDAVGIYTFYSTICIGIMSLGTSVSHQFLPRIVAAHGESPAAFKQVIAIFLFAQSAVAGSMALLTAAAVWPILLVLQLNLYADWIHVFYVMLLGAMLRAVSDVPSYALYAARADRRLLACNLGAAALSLVLNVLLVPHIGLMGSAVAMAVSSAFVLIALGAPVLSRLRR